ncbi:hypothetical protein H8959_011973 [Pygathrix nigripes]
MLSPQSRVGRRQRRGRRWQGKWEVARPRGLLPDSPALPPPPPGNGAHQGVAGPRVGCARGAPQRRDRDNEDALAFSRRSCSRRSPGPWPTSAARRSGRGRAGEGAPGARRGRRGGGDAGRLGLRRSFLLCSFLFRSRRRRRGPSLALISAVLGHRLPAAAARRLLCRRLPASLSATFLPPSRSLPAASRAPPPLAPPPPPPPPPPPAGSPPSPCAPAAPRLQRAAFGDVPLPSQERRAAAVVLPGAPARASAGPRQVRGARGRAPAPRGAGNRVKSGGAGAFPSPAGGGASAWLGSAWRAGVRGGRMRGAKGGAPSRSVAGGLGDPRGAARGGWGPVVMATGGGGGWDGGGGGRELIRIAPNRFHASFGTDPRGASRGASGRARAGRASSCLVVPLLAKLPGVFGGRAGSLVLGWSGRQAWPAWLPWLTLGPFWHLPLLLETQWKEVIVCPAVPSKEGPTRGWLSRVSGWWGRHLLSYGLPKPREFPPDSHLPAVLWPAHPTPSVHLSEGSPRAPVPWSPTCRGDLLIGKF